MSSHGWLIKSRMTPFTQKHEHRHHLMCLVDLVWIDHPWTLPLKSSCVLLKARVSLWLLFLSFDVLLRRDSWSWFLQHLFSKATSVWLKRHYLRCCPSLKSWSEVLDPSTSHILCLMAGDRLILLFFPLRWALADCRRKVESRRYFSLRLVS